MKVAGIEVGDRPLILAPMEDVTNPPCICRCVGSFGE